MTSWRTRISVGLAIGAAAISVPLSAGAAYAADGVVAGGGYDSKAECDADGRDYITHDYHDYTEFKCEADGGSWRMLVR
ncbi:hypothetical protein ACFO4E_25510 [Nocardiopsis mangrovi]|uniref:Uncharacterized protein n=1 Tax=Nocardiopsis mangrovi TaxID=1179818 RepID=A0ABV9E290_9ACTN